MTREASGVRYDARRGHSLASAASIVGLLEALIRLCTVVVASVSVVCQSVAGVEHVLERRPHRDCE